MVRKEAGSNVPAMRGGNVRMAEIPPGEDAIQAVPLADSMARSRCPTKYT
jgi:hypothetical protein